MASGPNEGIYRIVSGGSPDDKAFCLEVGGGDMTSGANVQIWGRLFAASQYWEVSYKGGSARIVNLASGKSLDVANGTMANGTNVRQFNDNGTAAQLWDLVPDGNDGIYYGVHYPTYVVHCHKNNTFALDIKGGTIANRSNVQIYTANGSTAQTWMFVPMEVFTSGGTYELRSMLKTSMCVDVAGGSEANGANIQLWNHTGSNSQKFYVTEEESGKFSIMSVASKKYVDVRNGASSVGTNVQQYADSDSRSQRWKLTQYGTTEIDGKDCVVVTLGSYVIDEGESRFMDVKNAMTTNSANIQLGAKESGTDYSQRFALYPTNAKSSDLVVPADLGWCENVGDIYRYSSLNEAETLYPSWTTSTSWTTDSQNGYQWRYRSHTLSAKTGEWADWSEWSAWAPVAVRVDGKSVWAADGLPASVADDEMQLQYELQVRAVTYVGDSDSDDRTGGELRVGEFTAATLTARNAITCTVGETLGYGPEGLRIPYTTNYNGTVGIIVRSVFTGTWTKPKEILSKAAIFQDMDASGTVLVPVSGFKRWINDGEKLGLIVETYADEGTVDHIIEVAQTATVSYNTGSGLDVTPTFTVGAGRTLKINLANAAFSGVWMRKDGTITQMDTYDYTADVLYPFGKSIEWEVFVAAHSADGDRWGVALIDGSQFNDLVKGFRPCHAFNWEDGGSFLLEVRQDEALETDYSIENDTDSYKLNRREWDTYRFGDTKTGKFKAVGALYEGFDLESTRDDLDKLIDARHVTYRSPHGLMCDVAVLEASMNCNMGIWTVTIDMARETV